MQQKTAIRKKMSNNRKKNYFETSTEFFDPLVKFLNKQKKNSINTLSLYHPSN